jgi:hypothetical protein
VVSSARSCIKTGGKHRRHEEDQGKNMHEEATHRSIIEAANTHHFLLRQAGLTRCRERIKRQAADRRRRRKEGATQGASIRTFGKSLLDLRRTVCQRLRRKFPPSSQAPAGTTPRSSRSSKRGWRAGLGECTSPLSQREVGKDRAREAPLSLKAVTTKKRRSGFVAH